MTLRCRFSTPSAVNASSAFLLRSYQNTSVMFLNPSNQLSIKHIHQPAQSWCRFELGLDLLPSKHEEIQFSSSSRWLWICCRQTVRTDRRRAGRQLHQHAERHSGKTGEREGRLQIESGSPSWTSPTGGQRSRQSADPEVFLKAEPRAKTRTAVEQRHVPSSSFSVVFIPPSRSPPVPAGLR